MLISLSMTPITRSVVAVPSWFASSISYGANVFCPEVRPVRTMEFSSMVAPSISSIQEWTTATFGSVRSASMIASSDA